MQRPEAGCAHDSPPILGLRVKPLYKILALTIIAPVLLGAMIFVSTLVLLIAMAGALVNDQS